MTAHRSLVWVLALLVAALLGAVAPAFAQDEPDYATWEKFATRVEATLDADTASEETLTALRSEVIIWRNNFLAAQKIKSTRLTTMKDQIASLGPPPPEGESEPNDVAERRKLLQAELAIEQAPALRATEAYGRADGLVVEIDKALHARQTSAILHRTPSPLLPSSWRAVLDDSIALVVGLTTDTETAISKADGLEVLERSLLTAALMLVLAIVLLGIGSRLGDRVPDRISQRMDAGAAGVIRFLASLTQHLLAIFGVYLAARAIDVSGLTGPWAKPFLEVATISGLIFFAGRWLAVELFPADPMLPALLGLVPPNRGQARRQARLLAAIMAVHYLIARPLMPLTNAGWMRSDFKPVPLPFSEAAASAMHLPFIILGAITLFRLGHLLRRSRLRPEETGPGPGLFATLASLSRLIAMAAPLGALAGYVTAANSILWPAATTLALVGFLLLLEGFISDLWQVIKGNAESARDALAPVLITFGLFVAAIPIVALIWGARVPYLIELWARISHGARIGSVRLSPGALITFIVVFMVGVAMTRSIQSVIGSTILPRTRIDKGGRNAIVAGLGYAGMVLAALFAITSAGIDLSSIAIVAGALSVGIGFGLQNIVSNFVSGIILLIERPVTVGDWVDVNGTMGTIQRISVRATTIQTFDRTDVVVPNSDFITNQVTNWTRTNLVGRIQVEAPVAIGSDTRKVSRIMTEIAEAQPTVLIDPAPYVILFDLRETALWFRIYAYLSDINQINTVTSEIRHQIAERFAEEGIGIPFTQHDVRAYSSKAPIPADYGVARTAHDIALKPD